VTGTLAIRPNGPYELELPMIIRKETDADIEAIAEVTIAAFKTLPISNHTEQCGKTFKIQIYGA
jgi:hypothetical protein